MHQWTSISKDLYHRTEKTGYIFIFLSEHSGIQKLKDVSSSALRHGLYLLQLMIRGLQR
jgi:hypothetical protein